MKVLNRLHRAITWLKVMVSFVQSNLERLRTVFRRVYPQKQEPVKGCDTTSYETSTETSNTTSDETSDETSEETSKETSEDISKTKPKKSTDEHSIVLNKIMSIIPSTVEKEEYTGFELFAYIFTIILVVVTFPFSLLVCCKIVFEYERAVIFRFGKLRKVPARGPGLIFVLICIDDCVIVDLRTETVYVYPQEVLTKDSVGIQLEAVIFFRLWDPVLGIISVGNYKRATLLLAQTTLRNIAGEKTLQELLLDREEFVRTMHESLVQGTDQWGVVVERVEIKDIRLPVDLQRSMAAEAEASRMAKANIISAEGEKIAANALTYASDVLSTSPGALHMRYLQTLRTCSISNDNIYVIPLYKELLQVCRSFMTNIQDPDVATSV